jgi:fructokinase
LPFFLENIANASIVRCSDEDLENLFPGELIETIYRKHIAPKCENFIVTQGQGVIQLKTPVFEKDYPVEAVQPVSTIGAGDNFNAGIIYGLIKNVIFADDLSGLCEKQWDEFISTGQDFAKEVCLSWENFVSQDFVKKLLTGSK